MLPDEWITPLPDRLPLDIDHGMSAADTIGCFRPYFDGDKLMMDATFASTSRAQEVRTLVAEGHVSAVSVAFMNDRAAKELGQPFRELLNAGVVGIGSNRDAKIVAAKAFDHDEFDRRWAAMMAEMKGQSADDAENQAKALRLRLKALRR